MTESSDPPYPNTIIPPVRNCLIALILLLACTPDERPFRFGFTPAENAKDQQTKTAPFLQHLSKRLDRPVHYFPVNDYAAAVEALKASKLDAALLGPLAGVLAEQEGAATIQLKTINGKRPNYYGIIIARADSGIQTLSQLKGTRFAFVDPVSTSGGLFPRFLLKQEGLEPERDFKQVIDAGSHDAVILAVLNHKVDAGATWSNDPQGHDSALHYLLKDPGQRAQIKVVAHTPAIPGEVVVFRSHLPAADAQVLTETLTALGETPQGRALIQPLSFTGFMPARSADYDVVRRIAAQEGFKSP